MICSHMASICHPWCVDYFIVWCNDLFYNIIIIHKIKYIDILYNGVLRTYYTNRTLLDDISVLPWMAICIMKPSVAEVYIIQDMCAMLMCKFSKKKTVIADIHLLDLNSLTRVKKSLLLCSEKKTILHCKDVFYAIISHDLCTAASYL